MKLRCDNSRATYEQLVYQQLSGFQVLFSCVGDGNFEFFNVDDENDPDTFAVECEANEKVCEFTWIKQR